MKKIYRLFFDLFNSLNKTKITTSEEKTFFDYSSGEKIKIMRAAGKKAQIEQQQLLDEYEARFNRTSS